MVVAAFFTGLPTIIQLLMCAVGLRFLDQTNSIPDIFFTFYLARGKARFLITQKKHILQSYEMSM